MTIKAVVDTSVLVSGIFWTGIPLQILKAWQLREFTMAVSPPIVEEYRRVLAEIAKRRALPVVPSVLELIELHSEMVEPVSFKKSVCIDPEDDKFLEAALAAGADYVVSGDRALLQVKNYRAIEVVRPGQFLKVLSLGR